MTIAIAHDAIPDPGVARIALGRRIVVLLPVLSRLVVAIFHVVIVTISFRPRRFILLEHQLSLGRDDIVLVVVLRVADILNPGIAIITRKMRGRRRRAPAYAVLGVGCDGLLP
jgi:hypothetical protein